MLNIPTKINKGTVEIVAPVELVKSGEKVGSSEAALLAKLNIRPFSYGEGLSEMLFFWNLELHLLVVFIAFVLSISRVWGLIIWLDCRPEAAFERSRKV